MQMNECSLFFRTRRFAVALTLLPLLILTSCGGGSSSSSSGSSSNAAPSFATTVFIGDSLTAGFQNGSLLDTQQPHGYANLIAQQANFSLALPLIAPPGAPAVIELVSPGPPPVTTTAPGTTTGRDDFTLQATDLAVPGHTLNDAINTAPAIQPTTGEEQLTQLVLGFPGLGYGADHSQMAWAQVLQPTTLFIWIGNNDALVADETGMPASMTSVSDFTTQFTLLMTTLKATTKARLIVANIPDVTAVPYLTPAAEVLAGASAETGVSTTTLAAILGLHTGDLVNPTGLAEVPVILAAALAGQPAGPIDDAGVLTAAEVVTVQAQVTAFNQVITAQAAATGATVVDIHALFDKFKTPQTINGVTVTNAFLGGLFGLDGIHPTNTGYALLANQFIDTMNSSLHTSITDVDVSTVASTDPLFPTNLAAAKSKPHARPTHISAKITGPMDKLFLHK